MTGPCCVTSFVVLGLFCGGGRAALLQIEVQTVVHITKCTSFRTKKQVEFVRSLYDETSYNGTSVSYLKSISR